MVDSSSLGSQPNYSARLDLENLQALPTLSIIVPTRNESGNVEPLLRRVQTAVRGLDVEVIFVDDSSDDTPDTIRRVSPCFPFPVRVVARPPERRNGLGKAVVEGMMAAQGDWLCVMDGDLQHPPEVIPQLLDHAFATQSTLVAASRLTAGGGTEGLSFRRKLISYGLAALSHVVFPKRLKQITDPLTGFFLVRRDALNPAELQPEGFKILLEVLVRSPNLHVSEVPFEFAERNAGESKANSREALLLFKQMFRLGLASQLHFLRFATVGVSGLVVNNLLLSLFVELLGIHYLIAAVLATQGSSIWNFIGTEEWVFRDRKRRQGYWGRFGSYLAMNNVALLLRGPLLAWLVSWFGMHYLLANIITLVVVMVARYALADRFIWAKPEPRPAEKHAAEARLHTMSIHSEDF